MNLLCVQYCLQRHALVFNCTSGADIFFVFCLDRDVLVKKLNIKLNLWIGKRPKRSYRVRRVARQNRQYHRIPTLRLNRTKQEPRSWRAAACLSPARVVVVSRVPQDLQTVETRCRCADETWTDLGISRMTTDGDRTKLFFFSQDNGSRQSIATVTSTIYEQSCR